jgi:uncharacterized repeat protein (TIGR03803 family)
MFMPGTIKTPSLRLFKAVLICSMTFSLLPNLRASAPLTPVAYYSFGTTTNDGASPSYILQRNGDTNIYGVAIGGGQFGDGTVFVMTPNGTVTNLYDFGGVPDVADGGSLGYDGIGPVTLVDGKDGNFYGCTRFGGFYPIEAGTFFQITPQGQFATLYRFASGGGNPAGALLLGDDQYLYGACERGGTNYSPGTGPGTIFQMTRAGSFHVIYQLNWDSDGQAPRLLARDLNGDFYGISNPGTNLTGGGLFKITSSGVFTMLQPGLVLSDLTLGSNGLLYGVTLQGGDNNAGTIFSLTTGGVMTTLYSFDVDAAASPDGAYPFFLQAASDGGIYGATSGATAGDPVPPAPQTLFKLGLDGTPMTLANNPYGFYVDSVVRAADGNLYGSSSSGGSSGAGAIFRLETPPSVITEAAMGVSSKAATLHGQLNAGSLSASAWFDYSPVTNQIINGSNTLYYAYNLPAQNITFSTNHVEFTAVLTNFPFSQFFNYIWHFRAHALSPAGEAVGGDMVLTNLNTSSLPTAITLTHTKLLNGVLQGFFTNTPGASFTVVFSTNLNLSLSDWSVLGPVTEVSPGQFQFTDPQAANGGKRFYCVRSP